MGGFAFVAQNLVGILVGHLVDQDLPGVIPGAIQHMLTAHADFIFFLGPGTQVCAHVPEAEQGLFHFLPFGFVQNPESMLPFHGQSVQDVSFQGFLEMDSVCSTIGHCC